MHATRARRPEQTAFANQLAPPHSVEAEQGVLGSMMDKHDGSKAITEAVAIIHAEFFYVLAHRTMFQIIVDLYDAGTATDLITVTEALRDRNLLDSVGGAGFVTHIATFMPTAANVAYYIDIVRDKYVLRQTLAACAEGARRAQEEGNPQSVLDELESKLTSIRSVHSRNGSDLSVRSPTEILAIPRDEHANYLGDRLLAKMQSLVIAGVGGIGKTRLLLQLLVAFIIGRLWCGIETHAKRIRCLLIQTENGTARLQIDLEALKKWAGKDWKLVDQSLVIHTLETDSDMLLHLSEAGNVRRLEATIRKVNPAIVSFDPLRDFGIGDLNSDADMSATLREVARIARIGNPDRALVLLHHALTGRAGAAKAFGLERTGFARNSKVLQTWARGFINVIPGSEDDNQTLILTCGKNSNGKEFPPVAVRLNAETMIYEVDSDFDIQSWRQQLISRKTKTGVKPQHLREILARGREYDKKQLAALIMEETGLGRSRAYEIIDQGRRRGVLQYNKMIKTYVLT